MAPNLLSSFFCQCSLFTTSREVTVYVQFVNSSILLLFWCGVFGNNGVCTVVFVLWRRESKMGRTTRVIRTLQIIYVSNICLFVVSYTACSRLCTLVTRGLINPYLILSRVAAISNRGAAKELKN